MVTIIKKKHLNVCCYIHQRCHEFFLTSRSQICILCKGLLSFDLKMKFDYIKKTPINNSKQRQICFKYYTPIILTRQSTTKKGFTNFIKAKLTHPWRLKRTFDRKKICSERTAICFNKNKNISNIVIQCVLF